MSDRLRAEQLLTLSSAARRLSDVVAAAETPLRFEVMRHLLRVSEETMIEVLEEVVAVGLVRRGDDAFTYVSFDDVIRADLVESLGPDRTARLRSQIESASLRVFE